MVEPRPSPCPVCRKPSTARTRPFCSVRCADIDLGRWFTESYAIPGPPPERDDPAPDDEA
ncbi:MAG: DNA gyrase inhibitor YacG [Rhodospirillales bacterium 70-18]|nr:DNA gyrase inhibitor YacG [Rhodospirillales bacterium]OJY68418.1 MAG: DNA gyrase inhibitor YacG [Rhodospirillales bacterium 70-18]